MFGLWPKQKTILLEHWYVLLEDFQTSTPEFYESIESALEERQVEGLQKSRVEFPEGGPGSPRRLYLRLRRERLIFDVCSAPFGTSWFFSCRFAEIPIKLRVWELLVLLGILTGIYALYWSAFGYLWGSATFTASILGTLYLLNSLVAMELYNLDAVLIKLPVIGTVYELFLRSNSYYREDTRLMYTDTVNRVIREKVEEFAGQEGVTKVEFKEVEQPMGAGVFGFMISVLRNLWAGSKKS